MKMLAPPIFPKWLPPAVTREAERILGMKFVNADLLIRLTTDKRMKGVWPVLKRSRFPNRPQLSETWANMRGPLPDGLSDLDAALTLFFWCAYAFAFIGITVGTVAEYDAMLTTYKKHAEQLRASAAVLRSLHLVPGPADKFLQYGDISQQFADIHARDVVGAAKFCDEVVDVITQLKAADPLVVERDYGNRDARGYVPLLAVEARKLFGKTNRRTLATVASVALKKTITDVQVRKWCASLDDDA